MAVLPYSSKFEMTGLFDANSLQWVRPNDTVTASLHIGKYLGMFSFSSECDPYEGIHTCREVFFYNMADDPLIKCMSPAVIEKDYMACAITLPHGVRAGLQLVKSEGYLNDEYILKKVVRANIEHDARPSLGLFFNKMQMFVNMRGGFRRLRNHTRRSTSEQKRVLVLAVLHRKSIEEVGLRMRMLRMARLW